MQSEGKFNVMPVGLVKFDDEIPNGISELTFDFYRSIAHLKMYNQFMSGIPTFVEVKVTGNTINLKLPDHTGNTLKVKLL